MFRFSVPVLLGAMLALPAAVAIAQPVGRPAKTQVFEGLIQEVRGIDGVLVLGWKEGGKERTREFRIEGARIVGPGRIGSEWKIGDLMVGDRVEVEMTRDGRFVREVRVVVPRRRI